MGHIFDPKGIVQRLSRVGVSQELLVDVVELIGSLRVAQQEADRLKFRVSELERGAVASGKRRERVTETADPTIEQSTLDREALIAQSATIARAWVGLDTPQPISLMASGSTEEQARALLDEQRQTHRTGGKRQ